MNRARLLSEWKREEARPFIGWNFSYLDGLIFVVAVSQLGHELSAHLD